MKKTVLAIFGFVSLTASALAQEGNNQVVPAAELALITGDASDASSIGFGVTVKGLYGIGEAGQVTFTTGYLTSPGKKKYKDLLGARRISSNMIPLLAGYRHHFEGNFFAEPQVGYGIYGAKVKGGDYAGSDSQGAFTWAIGGGYTHENIELGIRYQSMHRDGSGSGFIGLRVGYTIPIQLK